MYVGFDTEYGFGRVRSLNGRFEPDITTGVPVCACLAFENGDVMEFAGPGDFARLGDILRDPHLTFVVHNAQAEMQFCRLAGLRFPDRYADTFLMSLPVAHATEFEPLGGAYSQASLAATAARLGVPFPAGGKDAMRESILHLRHADEFGMPAVLDYCARDAKACLAIFAPLSAEFARLCGPGAATNLAALHQPFAAVTAGVAAKGMRFDLDRWTQLEELGDVYKAKLVGVMGRYGYRHDGVGIGQVGFSRMLSHLGFDRDWPRTAGGHFQVQKSDLGERRHRHEAIDAAYRFTRFAATMSQNLGDLVDRDGRLRCGMMPFAQRSSRTSTSRPNLGGVPGELRPLFLPDEGCRFVAFDFSQQELGVAAALSGDTGLLHDFASGDVYVGTGRRMGLITPPMNSAEVKTVRDGVLKTLLLSILYGKGAAAIARDLPCPPLRAENYLGRLERAYPRLFQWLRSSVAESMQRGWAESVIGYRASFKVRTEAERSHVARSCQNFPVQASAAACFQATGVHLGEYGADIRLGLHDAYVINVPDEPGSIARLREQIDAAAHAATGELFPGLKVKYEVEVLGRFAKRDEGSLDTLLDSLKAEGGAPCPSA